MREINTEALMSTPNAVAHAAQIIRELGHVRRERAQLDANLQDLIQTECRMAERSSLGWDDPQVKRIGATIDGYGTQLDDLTARIAALHARLEETPTEPLPVIVPVVSAVTVQQSA